MRRSPRSTFPATPGAGLPARCGFLKRSRSRALNWAGGGHPLDLCWGRGRGCSCSIATTGLPIESSSSRCMTLVQRHHHGPLIADRRPGAICASAWRDCARSGGSRRLRCPAFPRGTMFESESVVEGRRVGDADDQCIDGLQARDRLAPRLLAGSVEQLEALVLQLRGGGCDGVGVGDLELD